MPRLMFFGVLLVAVFSGFFYLLTSTPFFENRKNIQRIVQATTIVVISFVATVLVIIALITANHIF